jgi:hypothetical protein
MARAREHFRHAFGGYSAPQSPDGLRWDIFDGRRDRDGSAEAAVQDGGRDASDDAVDEDELGSSDLSKAAAYGGREVPRLAWGRPERG